MIYIPPQAMIFTIPMPIASESDIDCQIAACKKTGLDPFSGSLFAFRDSEATRIGVLTYDGHGFYWCIKRFSSGKIAWWPSEDKVARISSHDLQIMLWGGDPKELNLPDMWRPLTPTENQL